MHITNDVFSSNFYKFVAVYLDNILVSSKTWDEQLLYVWAAWGRLCQHQF